MYLIKFYKFKHHCSESWAVFSVAKITSGMKNYVLLLFLPFQSPDDLKLTADSRGKKNTKCNLSEHFWLQKSAVFGIYDSLSPSLFFFNHLLKTPSDKGCAPKQWIRQQWEKQLRYYGNPYYFSSLVSVKVISWTSPISRIKFEQAKNSPFSHNTTNFM